MTTISLSSIQLTFGGNYEINLSEYYLNSCYIFSPDGIGIPTSNQISFSQFIGKSKTKSYINTPWNINMPANMDATGGTRMLLNEIDDNYASIGGGNVDTLGSSIGFPFYWYGINFGTGNNNIHWSTNNVLSFGQGISYYYENPLLAAQNRGVFMGYADRKGWGINSTSVSHVQFPVITNGVSKIKRFWVKHYNHYDDTPISTGGVSSIEMEIFLIRDTKYQYILIRMAKWTAANTGIWNISDGTSYKNVFYDFPVKTGDSVLLIGSLTGYDWVSYNLPYKNAITNIGSNLVLRLDGYNIDGKNNSTLTPSTSTISSWYNSTITSFTTTQSTTSYKPGYTENGVVFSTNNYLFSTISLRDYLIMNIFVVFKIPTRPSNTTCFLWTGVSANNVRTRSLSFNTSDYIVIRDRNSNALSIYYPFNTNTIYVVNCEYNLSGQIGGFWINNDLKGTFTYTAPVIEQDITYQTIFGASNASGEFSFIGQIYEIIIIDRLLKDFERRNIYNHLNTRWNTNILPDSIKIILRLDGKNIDSTDNSTLTSGTSTISSWFNSGNLASLTTTQTDEAKRPTYTNNSAVFETNKELNSTIVLSNYQIMNIIVVWSLTTMPDFNTGSGIYVLWSDEEARRIIYINSNSILIGKGYSSQNNILNISNTFTLNTTVIYNLEYNLEGQPGNFYINNILKTSSGFTTLIAANSSFTGNRKTYFGYVSNANSNMYHLNGNIYEIIIINGLLTDTERTIIYNLLKTKWNVP